MTDAVRWEQPSQSPGPAAGHQSALTYTDATSGFAAQRALHFSRWQAIYKFCRR